MKMAMVSDSSMPSLIQISGYTAMTAAAASPADVARDAPDQEADDDDRGDAEHRRRETVRGHAVEPEQ